MPEPLRTRRPFRTQRLVEFADTDMAGIAHFSAFFRWMEAAEHELLRSLGFSVYSKTDAEHALSFPRVSATCDYRAPARCEDELDIAVTVDRLGDKSVTYAFRFLLGETLVAEGKMTSVCCKIVSGKSPESVAIPDEMRAGLAPFATA